MTPRKILVPLDGSPLADAVLPLVQAMAQASGARVTLLRVEPLVVTEVPSPILAGSLWDPGAAAASLSPQRDRLAAAGLDVEAVAAYGVVAAEILRAAADVDLLAIATHGRSGVARWWFGSRRSACSSSPMLRPSNCPPAALSRLSAVATIIPTSPGSSARCSRPEGRPGNGRSPVGRGHARFVDRRIRGSRVVDLDAVAMQQGDMGGKIRAVLAKRLGTPTIPQIFVGGEHVGGATETMDAFNSGRLQELFRKHGVAFDAGFRADAYSFLPKWLQKRPG